MTTDSFMALWGWIYAIGLGSFFVVAAFVIPLGARDILRLLRAASEEERPDRVRSREGATSHQRAARPGKGRPGGER